MIGIRGWISMDVLHRHQPILVEKTTGVYQKGGVRNREYMPIIRYGCKKCKKVCETLDYELLGIGKYRYKYWREPDEDTGD